MEDTENVFIFLKNSLVGTAMEIGIPGNNQMTAGTPIKRNSLI